MAKVDFAKGHGMILSGSVKYARLTNESGKDQMSEKYAADLFLDDESTNALRGLKVLDHVRAKDATGQIKDTENNVVKIKSINIPKGYLRNRQTFDGLIGDGTKIRANVWIKRYEYNGKAGLSIWLSAYVIMELVEYAQGNEEALFEGLPDLGDPEPDQISVPNNKPKVSNVVDIPEGEDDLPF